MATCKSALWNEARRVKKIINHCEAAFQAIVQQDMMLSTADIRRLARTVPGICYIQESTAEVVLEEYCQNC